jgi:hypothetical protein
VSLCEKKKNSESLETERGGTEVMIQTHIQELPYLDLHQRLDVLTAFVVFLGPSKRMPDSSLK